MRTPAEPAPASRRAPTARIDQRVLRRVSFSLIALAALAIPFAGASATDTAPTLLAADGFTRTVSRGWGGAETGGAYATAADASMLSVDGSTGSIALREAGAIGIARLPAVAARDLDVKVRVRTDSVPTGSGQYVSIALRRTAAGAEYRARVRFAADGTVWASIWRARDGGAQALGPETRVEGVTHAPGRGLWLRGRAVGADPTIVRMRLWTVGAAQPAAWAVSATDSADIRASGSVGLRAFLPRDASRVPVRFAFDDLRARQPIVAPQPTPTTSATPHPSADPTPRPSATASPTREPDPTAPPAVDPYALDDFERSLTGGWGRDALGAEYGLYGPVSDFAVDGRVGSLRLSAAGNTRSATLGTVTARDVDISFRVRTDKQPVDGSQYVYGVARRVSAGNEYRLKIRFAPNGTAWVQVTRLVDRLETSLGEETRVDGVTRGPNTFVWVRAQLVGASPTTLRMRAWAHGQVEPSGWVYTATDAEPRLQTAGAVGLMAHVSASSTNAPVRFSFDDLRAVAPSNAPVPPPTPDPTPQPTPDPTPVPTPTQVPTPTPDSTPTVTPTPSPTTTPTPVPTPTPTGTPAPSIPADAFVVAPSGSDSNPGTAAAPWLTLQKAANSVPAGRTVYVRAGTYAGFSTNRSGNPGDPTVFTRYPGDARPVIDSLGTRLDVVKISGAHDLRISGLVIQNAAGGTFSGSGIRTDSGAHHIEIVDNVIRDNQSFGVNLHSSTYILVQGNDISGNAEGVQVSYAGEGTRILDNRVHHNDLMLRNTPRDVNAHDDAGAVGIGFHKSSGNVVASGNLVWGNRAFSYDYTWDGSAFDIYGGSNVTIVDNVAWDNENVLETGTDSNSPSCRNNRFVRNVAYAATTEGRSWGMFLRCAEDMVVANNTFDHLEGFAFSLGYASRTFSSSIERLRIVNNVVVMGSGKVYGFETALPTSVVIDHNLVHSDSGYIATDVPGHGATRSLATFTSWTGYDAKSIDVGDPRFVDAPARDYRLRADSAAIDRGTQVSGVTSFYTGTAPDLGRHERP